MRVINRDAFTGVVFGCQKINEARFMIRNPTIREFEAIVTQRVLLDRLVDKQRVLRTRYSFDEARTAVYFTCNDFLKEIGASRDLWVRSRGRRLYMFHEPTNRIVAEVGVITDEAEHGMRRRLRVELFGKKGRGLLPTIGDVIVATAKLGHSGYNQRGKLVKKPEGGRNG